MKKQLFLILLTGFTLMLIACGNADSSGSSPEENELVDNGGYLSDDEEPLPLDEPLGTGDRECLTIRVDGDNVMSMDDFFDSFNLHEEIMDEYLGDVERFFNAHIDNYAGLFYAGSGEYVILLADDLENWETPELLADINFTVCRVEHSYNELAAVRTQIENNYTATSAEITGWGIGTLENSVLVYLAELTDEVILDFKENVSDSPLIEFIEEGKAVFNATILELHDEPQVDWYGDMTILVTSEEHGRMVFNHRRLEDIGATVGDIVELTITGGWVQPDPQPVYPDSWRLID